MVLDGGGDQVPAGVGAGERRAADGEVVGFGAAGGEDDFARRAFERPGEGVAGVVEHGARRLRFLVDARGVAPGVAQRVEHRIEHAGVERGGGGVVKVGALHGPQSICVN